MKKPIKIIDLFAGPGGLGEGFAAFQNTTEDRMFKICLSVEKESNAHRTLQLRAFYRQFPEGEAPPEYYDFIAGKSGEDPANYLYKEPRYRKQATAAAEEARQLTLGKDNRTINAAISNALGQRPGPWVLIGGPPCQAYSVAGRSRNKGIKNYCAEKDHRNFLYEEYLKVIARFRPAVFVMENVKGMLSASAGGRPIFPEIFSDLQYPVRATGIGDRKIEYEIFSLVIKPSRGEHLEGNNDSSPRDYLIYSENHGVPQARHRVILLGIRKDFVSKWSHQTLAECSPPGLQQIIGDLPELRSGLSRQNDSLQDWVNSICKDADKVIGEVEYAGLYSVAEKMERAVKRISKSTLDRGSNWDTGIKSGISTSVNRKLRNWYLDKSGWRGICNHETRGHIVSDLYRYLFCASYGKAATKGAPWTPKSQEFPKPLIPAHSNWHSGHFDDRFRVQAANRIATTITSHISKDGHYFIHYDPAQCRSLTVREAARIQTFPDNYFFVGKRTPQYVQVGNAVPPYLAHQIADIVYKLII